MAFKQLSKPISEIIKEWTPSGNYIVSEANEINIPIEEFNIARLNIESRLHVKLQTGKCSSVLLDQLTLSKLNYCHRFADIIQFYHFQTIIDIIECVEKSNHVNIRPFNKLPLKGLLHVHHNSVTFTAQNMLNCWRSMVGRNNEIVFQNQLLDQIYSKLRSEMPEEDAQKKTLTMLLFKIHNQAIFREVSKQTGEWVVYFKGISCNYYLCLATHNETQLLGDQVVLDRIAPCLEEFPELKSMLESRIS